jgi:CDP-glucose 4,6-dehydratase
MSLGTNSVLLAIARKFIMSNWSNKKIMVTGATGMLGSWLVKRLLAEGADVTVFVYEEPQTSELIRSGDIQKCHVIYGDLKSLEDVQKAFSTPVYDFIFHLGALTIVKDAIDDPLVALQTNVFGTSYLFEAVRKSQAPYPGILVASSDKAYGTSKSLPYNETSPLAGEGPYDVSKSCTDLIARSFHLTYGIPTVIARCGNIYGGGDLNWSRIVPGTIKSLLSGERPLIRSNGLFLRDYVYVEDVVNAYLFMAEQIESPRVDGEAFNFSREEPLTVLDIYEALCKATVGEYVEPKILNQAKHEIIDQHLSSRKAREVLKWKSLFSLDEGLKLTVEWYRTVIFS